MQANDRQVTSASRNLLSEYMSLLELIQAELVKETDDEPIDGKDSFEFARKAIRKEARKEAFQDFINRIKTHGNKRFE